MSRELPESEIFALLSKRHRRLTLQILQESASPLVVPELAKRIWARECEKPSTDDFKTIYIDLHHNHLPRLDDDDVVVYEQDENIVYPDRNFDVVMCVLERANGQNLSWADD